MNKKKIGFIDYYISEWHANHYPQWIKEANERLGTDYEVAYVWAERDISPVDGISTDEWCKRFRVSRCDTIAELCKKSDYIMILAPSDPDKHFRYAKDAFPCGKRIYVDKTFAPDLKTAKAIFKIADACQTPFFSTSALRYATELREIGKANHMIFTAGGQSFNEYVIHPVEMAVSLLRDPVQKVKVEPIGAQRICRIVTRNDADAAIVYSPAAAYSITGQCNGIFFQKNITSNFFSDLITDILRFFESGQLPFDPAQTLEVMRVRDALLKAESQDGDWIEPDPYEEA